MTVSGQEIVRMLDENMLDEVSAIGSDAIPALLDALKHEDPEVRWRAVIALMLIGDASVVPDLIEALDDGDGNVSSFAAEALGSMGDVSAVPVLIRALGDSRMAVRTAGVYALSRFGRKGGLTKENLISIASCLKGLVDRTSNEGDSVETMDAKQWAMETFQKISDSIRESKQGIGMDGVMLDAKIPRLPGKDKMFRAKMRVTT